MDITLERILSLIPKKPDGNYVHGAKKKFCESIGAPTNIISEWEAGKTKSYRNYLFAISARCNVSVEWLEGKTDIKNKPTAQGDELSELQRKALELFDLVPEDRQEDLLSIIEIYLRNQ